MGATAAAPWLCRPAGATARAQHAARGALLPNAPSLNGNDKVAGSKCNHLTAQAGLSTLVWLPGEGTAAPRLAQPAGP